MSTYFQKTVIGKLKLSSFWAKYEMPEREQARYSPSPYVAVEAHVDLLGLEHDFFLIKVMSTTCILSTSTCQ